MVHLRNLKKSYSGIYVLKGLDMNIERGDIYGFIGRNGCGKTTTMNIICDIIPKDSGEVVLGNGEKIKIGYLPETPSLFGYMNSYEYLKYIASCCKYEGDVDRRIAEVLEQVNLRDGAGRKIKGYSRGMNQRLGIAAAIFDSPDLLILDEPTSALDPSGRAEVISVIEGLCETGTTVLLCTHILTDVERIANKVGFMANGKMVIEGEIKSVIEQYSQGNALKVKLIKQNPEVITEIRNLPTVKDCKIDTKTGELMLTGENVELLSAAVIGVLAENNIGAQKIEISHPSLENIYIDMQKQYEGGRRNAN